MTLRRSFSTCRFGLLEDLDGTMTMTMIERQLSILLLRLLLLRLHCMTLLGVTTSERQSRWLLLLLLLRLRCMTRLSVQLHQRSLTLRVALTTHFYVVQSLNMQLTSGHDGAHLASLYPMIYFLTRSITLECFLNSFVRHASVHFRHYSTLVTHDLQTF